MRSNQYHSMPKITAIAAAVAMLTFGSVDAQEAAGVTSKDEAGNVGLQVYTVTAQKRVQPMQKVPVAIDVVNAKAMEDQHIVEFTDLVRVSPSMTINQSTNSVSLRGIGTYAFSIGVEPAVSIIIDDVPVVQQSQAFSNLSDIERVEVLRGPQGTLFGKNSSAGVINIVTQESTSYMSGSAQLTATSDKEIRAEASVSGPINEIAGFRLNAYNTHRTGYIKNLTNGADLNGESGSGVRARIDLRPATDVKVKLIGDYSTRNQVGPVQTLYSAPAGAKVLGAVELAPAIAGITPGEGNFNARISDPGFSDNKQASLSANVSWKLGDNTVTSVTSYQDWKFNYLQDVDGTEIVIPAAVSGGAPKGSINQYGPYQSTQLTQELRLASNSAGPLNYLGGLFYSHAESDRSFERFPVLLAKWSATAGNKSIAAFTQIDYTLTPTTRVSGGLRANKESINVRFTNQLPAVAETFVGSSSDTAYTGKLSLQHDLEKNVMVYTTYSTGYKGAGFDISTGFNQAKANRPVNPETSVSYEAGIKSRSFENRLQLNATAFLTNYVDFQAQAAVQDPKTGAIQLGLNNVGELQTKGVELEISAKPSKALLLESSIAYVNATIAKFPTANCYPGQTVALGCYVLSGASVQNLAGSPLANSPKLKANFAGTYEFAMPVADLTGAVNVNYQYQSEVNFDLFRNPLATQKAYGILNGSFSIMNDSKQAKLTLFVNNILNQHYTANISDVAGSFGGAHVLTATLPRNSQRYFGARVKYDF